MRPRASFYFGVHAADGQVRALVIIGHYPSGSVVLNLFDTVEQVVCQPIVANRAVISLNIGVLLRFAGLDDVKVDARPGLLPKLSMQH
jgi:hypothetical protein